MQTLIDIVKGRRSVRTFDGNPIRTEDRDKLTEERQGDGSSVLISKVIIERICREKAAGQNNSLTGDGKRQKNRPPVLRGRAQAPFVALKVRPALAVQLLSYAPRSKC